MSAPHNTELERVLVAGMFSDDAAVRHEILLQAKPEFFYDQNLRLLFEISAFGADEPTVAYDKAWERNPGLKTQLDRDEFGEILKLKSQDYGEVIKRLRKLWSRRQAIELAKDIIDSKGRIEANIIAEKATSLAIYGEVSHYNDRPDECTDSILDVALNGPDKSVRDGFGIESLDVALRGLKRNDFVILGAPANTGKTPLGIYGMLQRVQADPLRHGIIFTLEMTKEDVTRELVAMRAGIPMDCMLNGLPDDKTRDEAQARIVEALEFCGKHFSIIDPTIGDLNKTLIRAIINRKIAELHSTGGKLDMVMIDYLQLLSDDSNEEITGWTRTFKKWAIELDTPFLLISSLNNSYLRRLENASPEDRYILPSMADFRGSGNIGFDASKVLFLMHKLEDGVPCTGKEFGNRYIYIMKNKYGMPHKLCKVNINRCLAYSDGHV